MLCLPPAPCRLLASAFKPVYWQALLVVSLLYLARFDASFLSLRAKQVGTGFGSTSKGLALRVNPNPNPNPKQVGTGLGSTSKARCCEGFRGVEWVGGSKHLTPNYNPENPNYHKTW